MDTKRLYDAELAGACRKAQAQQSRRSIGPILDPESDILRIEATASSTLDLDQCEAVRAIVADLWPSWSGLERVVYKLRFVSDWPMNQLEIASAVNISQPTISRCENRVLRQIKAAYLNT